MFGCISIHAGLDLLPALTGLDGALAAAETSDDADRMQALESDRRGSL